jgi:hypothetical protein
LLIVARDPLYGDRVIPLCRMLFAARAGQEFRRPVLGYAEPINGVDDQEWPLLPLHIIDGVPFFVVRGYALGGVPESGESYLQYCLANCDWSTVRFNVKTATEKTRAVAKLMLCKKWTDPKEASEIFSEQIE